MRDIDDKIIYALNTSIPTESFKGQLSASETCKDLHGKLNVAHEDRCNLIKNCIAVTADRVKQLKAHKDDDTNAHKSFKSEQRKVSQNKERRHCRCIISDTIGYRTNHFYSFVASIVAVRAECRGHCERPHQQDVPRTLPTILPCSVKCENMCNTKQRLLSGLAIESMLFSLDMNYELVFLRKNTHFSTEQ